MLDISHEGTESNTYDHKDKNLNGEIFIIFWNKIYLHYTYYHKTNRTNEPLVDQSIADLDIEHHCQKGYFSRSKISGDCQNIGCSNFIFNQRFLVYILVKSLLNSHRNGKNKTKMNYSNW